MKRWSPLLLALMSSTALAQTPPATATWGIGVPAPNQPLQVLDATRTWVPIGVVDPTTHTFSVNSSSYVSGLNVGITKSIVAGNCTLQITGGIITSSTGTGC